MERIITVSNRLPVTVSRRDGKILFSQSTGGLATGLSNTTGNNNNLWIGWAGFPKEDFEDDLNYITSKLSEKDIAPVFLERPDIELFYEGFSNTTVWPLFHYFPKYTYFFAKQWEKYIEVNQRFADEVIKHATPDDIIWIHDYHLMLVPSMVRKAIPDARIAYFQHIPFPSYEIFRILPCREEILNGLLGADLIGFHTHDDVKHFLDSVNRITGIDNTMGELRRDERIIQVDAFPLGIDYTYFEKLASSKETQNQMEKYRSDLGDGKIILSIDRLDYSKGIPERLMALELFLERYPEYHGKVTLVMIVVPSREKVQMYKNLKTEIDELVGNINSKFRTMKWSPVLYMYRSFSLQSLSAFYNIADVALITPLRDGMNLVCKEYIASRSDKTGVLILSEMAGAAKELNDAIIINPYNIEDVADAIKEALSIPVAEQIKRMDDMQALLKTYTANHWIKMFLERLDAVKSKQEEMSMKVFNPTTEKKIIRNFLRAEKRVLFLDYDGTLVPIKEKPELAKPDKELISLLGYINSIPNTEVVLVTGRDKNTMDKWFRDLNIEIIAEHGAYVRQNNIWCSNSGISEDWRDNVKKILSVFVNRTPGSFIEEKESSVAWHYRKSDADLAKARVRELKDYLQYFTKSMNLSVLEGKKVVEIKPSYYSKGTAVKERLLRNNYEFIFCAGDDWTDEDMFKEMPSHAFTLKVGYVPSYAKYNIRSCDNTACSEVRGFLKRLISDIKEESLLNENIGYRG